MLVLLLILVSTLSPVAFGSCYAGNNKPLQEMRTFLQSHASAEQKSKKLADSVNMRLFAKKAIPDKIATRLSPADKKQFNLFLRHAIQANLFNIFNHQGLDHYHYDKTVCLSKSKQLLIGGKSNSTTHLYIPLILLYQKASQWQLVNVTIYTSFLSSAYAYQFNNWLQKHSLNQIIVAIKKQNAILSSKQSSAS